MKPKENLKHTGDNAEQAKITENEAGSTESCVVEELPFRKTAIESKVDGEWRHMPKVIEKHC